MKANRSTIEAHRHWLCCLLVLGLALTLNASAPLPLVHDGCDNAPEHAPEFAGCGDLPVEPPSCCDPAGSSAPPCCSLDNDRSYDVRVERQLSPVAPQVRTAPAPKFFLTPPATATLLLDRSHTGPEFTLPVLDRKQDLRI